ncbi:MAG: NUDIX domain-containing protein [Patescibacteria group bacterium]|nr:NUDIX domain-containing protein [Patescibacteria group bacterium]
MNLAFGCVVILDQKILLVREESEKHKQLENWNIVSGKVDSKEFIFDIAIKREIKEETGIKVDMKGVIAIYESITPVDRAVYFVVGCEALSKDIVIGDSDVKEAKFFELEKFWKMTEKELVHEDMKLVTRNFLDGKYIDIVKSVRYG